MHVAGGGSKWLLTMQTSIFCAAANCAWPYKADESNSSENLWCMLQLGRGDQRLSLLRPMVSMIQTHSADFLDAVMVESRLHQQYWHGHRHSQRSLMSRGEMLRRDADKSLDQLIGEFEEKNKGSSDACHARLLEAKHLLNELHTRLQDLQRDIEAKEDVVEAEQAVLEGERTKKKALEEWKEGELQKCQEERDEAERMYQQYSNELKELQQIAAPNVTMALNRNKTSGNVSARLVSLLQEASSRPVTSLSLLGLGTQVHDAFKAHQNFVQCLHDSQSPNATVTASPEVCAEQQEQLKQNFTKAYVSIKKMKDSYDEARNDTICDQGVQDEFQGRLNPVLEKITQAADNLEDALKALRDLNSELTRLNDAVERLEKHIKELADTCKESTEVTKYLGNVRDLIMDMKKCPGLDRVKFVVATFKGFAIWSQSASDSDEAQDTLMDAACRGLKVEGIRAALHSEIMSASIVGGPVNNTGAADVMGKCTGDDCAGNVVTTATSGHARICWKRGAALTAQSADKTCSSGLRVVPCVTEAAPPKPEQQESANATGTQATGANTTANTTAVATAAAAANATNATNLISAANATNATALVGIMRVKGTLEPAGHANSSSAFHGIIDKVAGLTDTAHTTNETHTAQTSATPATAKPHTAEPKGTTPKSLIALGDYYYNEGYDNERDDNQEGDDNERDDNEDDD